MSERLVIRSRRMVLPSGEAEAAAAVRDNRIELLTDYDAPIEADHMIGDMLQRGEKDGIASPLLRVVHAHLKTYEARRQRESAKH